MTPGNGSAADLEQRTLLLDRVFDAPREVVFNAWSEPEHLIQWWGPRGFTSDIEKMEFRVGGAYRIHMRSPEGTDHWSQGVYREIVPPELLVWEHSFSDEAGGLTRHPLSPTWPLKLLTRLTLEEAAGNKTKLTLCWTPLEATADEQKTFAAAHDSMQGGWTGTFDQLAAHLARVGAKD